MGYSIKDKKCITITDAFHKIFKNLIANQITHEQIKAMNFTIDQ